MAVRHVHVNPQHFAEELSRILGAMIRVVCRPAVAKTDVEEPIRAERKVSAVVIGEWLRDERGSSSSTPMQIEPRRGIGNHRIGRPHKARDDGVSSKICKVDEESAACCVIGRKGEPEKPALSARAHGCTEIQEIGWQNYAVADDANATALLDYILHVAVGWILDESHWQREA
jgi:hypothetical protein